MDDHRKEHKWLHLSLHLNYYSENWFFFFGGLQCFVIVLIVSMFCRSTCFMWYACRMTKDFHLVAALTALLAALSNKLLKKIHINNIIWKEINGKKVHTLSNCDRETWVFTDSYKRWKQPNCIDKLTSVQFCHHFHFKHPLCNGTQQTSFLHSWLRKNLWMFFKVSAPLIVEHSP